MASSNIQKTTIQNKSSAAGSDTSGFLTIDSMVDGLINSISSDVNDALSLTSSNQTYEANTIKDRRISLNVCPKDYYGKIDYSSYQQRLIDTLGSSVTNVNGTNIYGLLYNHLLSSAGLIFPYTPSIQMSRQVGYDSLEVFHSNFSTNYYKNTPAPTINMSEVIFTADTRENALHMLSAILFLTACCQSEFGEQSDKRDKAGLPPPILYLNGYDNLIDNIPVVIKSIGYNYPKDKHYVNLIIDLSKESNYISDLVDGDDSYITGNIFSYGSLVSQSNYKLSFWLPTELSFNIQLVVQPNPLKVKYVYDLDKFKSGAMFYDKESYTKSYTQNVGKLVNYNGNTYAISQTELDKIQSSEVQETLNDSQITDNIQSTTKTIKNNTGWFW